MTDVDRPSPRARAVRLLKGIEFYPQPWPTAFEAEGALLADCRSNGESSPWVGGTKAAAELIAAAPSLIRDLLAALDASQRAQQELQDLLLTARVVPCDSLRCHWEIRAETLKNESARLHAALDTATHSLTEARKRSEMFEKRVGEMITLLSGDADDLGPQLAFDRMKERCDYMLRATAAEQQLAEARKDVERLTEERDQARALINQLWDIAAKFSSPECNAIRDPIHLFNAGKPQAEAQLTTLRARIEGLAAKWRDPEYWGATGNMLDSIDCADELSALLRETPDVQA